MPALIRWLTIQTQPWNDCLQYIQDIQQLTLNVAVGSLKEVHPLPILAITVLP